MAPATLTPAQLHALFDILTHKETYLEVGRFKYPFSVREYGYPFDHDVTPGISPTYYPQSSSPLLQLLLTRCVLTIPGVSDLPVAFWPVHLQGIMTKLAEADLSESYDKGAPGTRKTLAALASVVHEAVTRGLLGGVAKRSERIGLKTAEYDTTQASELARAWHDCVHELVHGDLVGELFDHTVQNADLEAHSPAVHAAIDYSILHIASLLHHIFVLSSEGRYLTKIIEYVHKLAPYSMVRQTLRIGNAATMMNGIMRIFMVKMSFGAITNKIGWTKDADDGLNLMQRIISLVLSWDASDFRKQVDSVESSKDGPSKEVLAALKEHIAKPREAHEQVRRTSILEQKSIIAAILDSSEAELSDGLGEAQHAQCLAWYAAQLSIRDRDEIGKVFCKSRPDFLTDILRGTLAAYEPFIRSLHSNMDLRPHVTSVETFLTEFIETSKPKHVKSHSVLKWPLHGSSSGRNTPVATRLPSVEDYVALLRRNRRYLYQFCHIVAKDVADVRDLFGDWAKRTLQQFSNVGASRRPGSAGAVSDELQDMFAQLAPETQKSVVASLDSHAAYLSKLSTVSKQRMQRVLDAVHEAPSRLDDKDGGLGPSCQDSPRTSVETSTTSGPGLYLMQWEAVLDETAITPATVHGPVRRGRDVKGQKIWGNKPGLEATMSSKTTMMTGAWDMGGDAILARARGESEVPMAPDVAVVLDVMGEKFRDIVRKAVGNVGPATRTMSLSEGSSPCCSQG